MSLDIFVVSFLFCFSLYQANTREAIRRLFRDWSNSGVRYTDLWGNVSAKGADGGASAITVKVHMGKHYSITDIANGSILYFNDKGGTGKKYRLSHIKYT